MHTIFLDGVMKEREQARCDVIGERSNGLRLSFLAHSHVVSQVLKQKPVRASASPRSGGRPRRRPDLGDGEVDRRPWRGLPVDPLLRCADLILPWLTPQELAAVSLTSAGLRRASPSVARRRSSDAARGLEPLPVPFLNAVGSRPYAYFLYAPSSFSQAPLPPNDALLPLRQPWGSSSRTASRPTAFPSREAADVVVGGVVLGCGCERCEGRDCACWGGDGGGEEGEEEEVVVVSECGPGCGCGLECGNRASQRGVEVRLKIARDKKKGWCLFADQAIEKGRFVCEYAGCQLP
ncbi:hypothetical protein NL676_036581 [Syzygium grande]|nr:hypothetical protein NL676_036581 [Syzygium grande]